MQNVEATSEQPLPPPPSGAFRPCIVFPCYNHAEQFARFLPKLLPFPCPAILVDDGSAPAEAARLSALAENTRGLTLLRSEKNRGKGRACLLGFEYALNAGFSHAFQIDADGQHSPEAVEKFLARARERPDAGIFGVPVYGADVPKARLYGRKITQFFVALETCSLRMRDALCGFRVYPLAPLAPLLKKRKIWGGGMGFDIRILVEMHWAEIPLVFEPVAVAYPAGGRSHFSPLRGNALVSLTHAGLCLRAPFHLGANFRMLRRATR